MQHRFGRGHSGRFDLEDETPSAEDWGELLSNRQNRDNVFGVVCEYIRVEHENILVQPPSEHGDGLSVVQLHLKQINLRIDGNLFGPQTLDDGGV